MTDNVCPPLGTGSVDFNALNDAAAAGENLKEALTAATTGGEPEIASTVEPAAPPPTLAGKNKAELLKIAADEGVDADEGMTNSAIVDAIEDHRAPDDDLAADYVAPLGPVVTDATDGGEPTE